MAYLLTRRGVAGVALALAALVLVFTLALVVAVGVVVVNFARNAPGRITIDPRGVAEAVVVTLSEGGPEQKVQLIGSLRDMGPDAREFVPALVARLGDGDDRVRAAAAEALKAIDPAAADQAGVK